MAQLPSFQTSKEEVEKILKELSKIHEIETNVNQTKEFLKSIKTSDKQYKVLVDQLTKLSGSVNQSINKFKEEKKKITDLLNITNIFYLNKYLPLVKKLDDPETGLSVKLKEANSLSKEISHVEASCKDQYGKIKKFTDGYVKTEKNLEKLETSIKKIFDKVQNNQIDSNELLSSIQGANDQIKILNYQINSLKESSSSNEKTIHDLQEKTFQTFSEIENIKLKSKEKLDEILNIYEMAADTGRSGEFDKRRKLLTIELKKWERYVVCSTVFLLLIIIALFISQLYLYGWKIEKIGTDLNFYFRFLLASPVVYFLTFTAIQYEKTKKLVDKYSFKTTIALSIKNHLELLSSNPKFQEPSHINDILKFTLEAFSKIYDEPYSTEELKISMKIKDIELNIEKTILSNIRKYLKIDSNAKTVH